ncbi:MAG: penicillin-binding transpeptidase domain-containing protein [Acutalibacteraceae bacterium]|nr:penicillin-binding transpeptidase domain-containing protein [Acutalibacteraceae bacterium]
MPFKKKHQTALTVLSIIMILVLLLYTARIYSIQIVKASEYSSLANGSTSVRKAVLKAPRGEILDRYGRQIAVNRDGYNIVFNKAYVGDDLNDIILSLINLLDNSGTEHTDKLPMEYSAPYAFKEDESNAKLIKVLDLADYATAENCFTHLVERYELENYSVDEQRKIMGVRYSMEIADFSISYPFTFAEDISTELMRKISESNFMLSGVSVEVVPFRQYPDTSLAVNLIGTVGPIFEEDWNGGENYKERGYSYDDKVGKSGIEYYAEEYLRGTDGEITYYIDNDGNIVNQEVTKAPIAGKTVMLTIDAKMQRTVQDALANTVRTLQSEGGTATAAAAVVIDINSGGVITSANYPTYDTATMSENYDALLADPSNPLTDRAFQGVYPIGSTIKPIVAAAALENNLYTNGELIFCKRTYDYFNDFRPSCMHYHGNMNLTMALSKSCNYFFFELGRRVGAITLTDYYKQFGLGVKTGVEVNDSAGILIEPTSNGFGGDTLQIAIGQLNAFTPLQLANYVATFANGGTHYKATLIDKIVSYDMTETYDNCEPVVLNTVSLKQSTISSIKEGMLSVTVDGTGHAALGDYPIKIGGKTGTSQVEGKADHSTFIVFAPYDNPEIAISVVLEHGSSTYASGNLVRQILDSYFSAGENSAQTVVPFTVIE